MKHRAGHPSQIMFFSTMAGAPWGGSEELWSQSAMELSSSGLFVTASVKDWQPLHVRLEKLIDSGVAVVPRDHHVSLAQKLWRRVHNEVDTFLGAHLRQLLKLNCPSLVVFSDGFAVPPVELLELCNLFEQPFVTVSHANDHTWWPDDAEAERYRAAITAARRCYFVSQGNLTLFEKQIAMRLTNAEVIWSPINVDYDASPPFPRDTLTSGLRLACVGRLHPPSKGQDALIEALVAPTWRDRKWKLHLYGEGSMKGGLQNLVGRFELSNFVSFAGLATPEAIWASNHALVMPSRFEGLPLTIIEAMLCGRPVAAANVGGNSEVIEDGVTGFLTRGPTIPDLRELLERLWAERSKLEDMGRQAAASIRLLAPREPAKIFATKLRELSSL